MKIRTAKNLDTWILACFWGGGGNCTTLPIIRYTFEKPPAFTRESLEPAYIICISGLQPKEMNAIIITTPFFATVTSSVLIVL